MSWDDRSELATGKHIEVSREEYDALRRELAAKDAQIARLRESCVRWLSIDQRFYDVSEDEWKRTVDYTRSALATSNHADPGDGERLTP